MDERYAITPRSVREALRGASGATFEAWLLLSEQAVTKIGRRWVPGLWCHNQEALAEREGVSLRSLQRAWKDLEDRGVIVRQRTEVHPDQRKAASQHGWTAIVVPSIFVPWATEHAPDFATWGGGFALLAGYRNLPDWSQVLVRGASA